MEIQVAERLQGVGEYYFSQKLREIEQLNKTGIPVINLGIGSPDMPPHPFVIETLAAETAKANVHGYQSYKGVQTLRNGFAQWYKKWYSVDLNADTEILPLIGSKEGIMHICMTYINKGDVVLVPNPGYPTYTSASTLAGGKVVEYNLREEKDWQPDFEEIEQLLSTSRGDAAKATLMFVNYPHMPTGKNGSKELFEQLVAFAKNNNILLVHDNPYSFILNNHPQSLLAVDGAKDVVIELNSLSKSHNMAGWRVGVVCGAKERIEEILRFKSNMDSGMFLPLQLAAAKALELGEEWFHDLNEVYRKRREKVFVLLDELNCQYDKEQVGLFVWARIPAEYETGFQLSDEILNKARVFITPGGIFGKNGDRYVRVSLCTTVEKLDESLSRVQEATIQK
jgi:aspartate/methionine/tyrosine aminotransferase